MPEGKRPTEIQSRRRKKMAITFDVFYWPWHKTPSSRMACHIPAACARLCTITDRFINQSTSSVPKAHLRMNLPETYVFDVPLRQRCKWAGGQVAAAKTPTKNEKRTEVKHLWNGEVSKERIEKWNSIRFYMCEAYYLYHCWAASCWMAIVISSRHMHTIRPPFIICGLLTCRACQGFRFLFCFIALLVFAKAYETYRRVHRIHS